MADYLDEFGTGLLTTIGLVVTSFLGAMLLALIVVSLRISPVPLLRKVGSAYVETFQNIPLLVWIVIVVFGLPEIGITFSLFSSAVIATAFYSASYYAGAIQSGVNAIAKAQGEAARALGLRFGQCLRHIVLPQAFRNSVPPLTNITIVLLMHTALAAAAGVVELTETANRINIALAEPIPVYVGAGACYAALALIIATGGRLIERRLGIPR